MLAKDLSSYYSVNDDKILTETDTETFVPIPNFPKSKPILFFRDQIIRNRYFFSETKFSGTETILFFQDQVFQNQDFFETKFSETDTFFSRQILGKRNPKKIGKSLETEKFRNRNVNLWR